MGQKIWGHFLSLLLAALYERFYFYFGFEDSVKDLVKGGTKSRDGEIAIDFSKYF